MNRPDRPCRMGPPSYVCWFRNPMNTIVIYVTWSPVVARCEFCAQIVARWPFWIVMWSPIVARCEFCAESGLPLWRCGHFGSLRGPSLRRSPRKLPTTRAQRCSCKQESFFLSFILLRIVWKWQWIGTETFGCFARQLFRVWHGTSTSKCAWTMWTYCLRQFPSTVEERRAANLLLPEEMGKETFGHAICS